MKIIENTKEMENINTKYSVVLEASASSLTQGCYKPGLIEGRFSSRC